MWFSMFSRKRHKVPDIASGHFWSALTGFFLVRTKDLKLLRKNRAEKQASGAGILCWRGHISHDFPVTKDIRENPAQSFTNCSFILIHDERIKKSYNFFNKDYANDETEVELAGYYFPQMCICENKDILFDIIIHFFETGKINEKYEWFEFDE